MKCTPMDFGNGVRGFVCGPRRLGHQCDMPGCTKPGERQCDYPEPRHRSGTCDKYLCAAHAVRQGKNRDYCPDHPGQMALAL